MKFFLILLPTILLVVYGQLITKWRVSVMSTSLEPSASILEKMFTYFRDPYILSAYVTVFIASIAWMFALERYPLSQAFPVQVSATFALVMLGSVYLLGETLSVLRLVGIGLILAGVFIVSRS